LKIKIIALFFLTSTVSGCGYQSDVIELNGYSIVCDKSRDCIVASSKGDTSVIIEPEVDKYFIVDGYIIGHSILPPNSDTLHHFSSNIAINQKPGYFVINTRNGQFFSGLDESGWHLKLKEMNISPPKELLRTGYRAH